LLLFVSKAAAGKIVPGRRMASGLLVHTWNDAQIRGSARARDSLGIYLGPFVPGRDSHLIERRRSRSRRRARPSGWRACRREMS